jgi:EAL domain-containing protein (putative c-di-GMP-specific phosphodiesterase class I)
VTLSTSAVAQLRDALNNGGFELWAQPILELASRRVTRHELLLRLRHDDGRTPTAQFLSVAEEIGLILDIDAWVVGAAFRLVRSELAAGRPCNVQVNLSGASVSDPGILEVVERELASCDVPGSCVTFEITETRAIADMAQAKRFANAVRSAGCGLSLDDFGVGFGTMYYLKHLPFDSLKIDGEFVGHIADSARDKHIVRGLVQIADSLHLDTVAEFVEETRTLRILEDLGVTYAQGYAIGRPRPATSLVTSMPTLPRQRGSATGSTTRAG